jgi:hypothetical protein
MSFGIHSQRVVTQQIPSLEAAVKNAQKHKDEKNEEKTDYACLSVEEEVASLANWAEAKSKEIADLCNKYKILQSKIKEVFG